MKLNEFLKKCYEKEIVKSLTIFIVASWTIIQVSEVTHEAVGLPEEFVSSLIILFFLISPFYIYRTWNRLGKEKDFDQLSETKKSESKAFKALFMRGLGLASLLCVGMIILVASNKFLNKSKVPFEKLVNTDKIAVLNFENNTGIDENDVIGKMASDWISHGIAKENVNQVISSEMINSYSDIVSSSKVKTTKSELLTKYLNPGQIISGSYYLIQDKYVFQVRLLDGKTNELLFSFDEESCASDEPLTCIEKIKQVILSYYVTKDKDQIILEDYPPKFEAYQLMLKAKELKNYTSDDFLRLLEESILKDPDYFEPKVSRIGYYYNIGDYDEAKAKIKELRLDKIESDRQKNIIRVYQSLLDGNSKEAYQYMNKEYLIAPYDLENNTSMMIMALQLVNDPSNVPIISEQISEDLINRAACQVCSERGKLLMDSYLMMNDPIKVVSLFRKFDQLQSRIEIYYPLITAYVKLEKDDLLNDLLQRAQQNFSSEDFQLLSAHAYNQSLIYDFPIDMSNVSVTQEMQIIKDFNQGNYAKVIQQVNQKQKDDLLTIYKAASIYKNGQKSRGDLLVESLFSLNYDKDYGYSEYQVARYYSLIGNQEKMFEFLERSIKNGYYFTDSTFTNDAIFRGVMQTKEFQTLLNYWN